MSEMGEVPENTEASFSCTDCNTTFLEATDFHNHTCKNSVNLEFSEIMEIKRSRGPYKCEKCGKRYKAERFLILHLQSHVETSDFTCNLCQKQFRTKVRLQCHYQTHTARYVCPVCHKGFGETGNLKKHLRIHSGERPFVCDICNKGFTQKRHLQDHKLTHIDKETQEDYTCDVCGRKFLTKSTLRVHKLCHDTALPFGCKKCNSSFAEYESFEVHVCAHTDDKSFYCNVCSKGFKRHTDLRAHLTVHTGEQPYVCEICQRAFHKYAILKMHMESHTEERKHICHLCNKAFKTFNVLKKHCLLHTGERNKTCKICNKSFKCANTLRTHYLTHSDERPFVCEICGKSFKRITPLQNHLTTHTGEQPYPCEVCGKRFARKSTLENHFILHTGKRPYVCPICNKTFTRKSSLKIHDATVHTKDTAPEKTDCKAQYLVAGDIARHAILAAHTYVAQDDIEKDKDKYSEQECASFGKDTMSENDNSTDTGTYETLTVNKDAPQKIVSADNCEDHDAADIEMEYSCNRSMDLVEPVDYKSVKVYDKFENEEIIVGAVDIEITEEETDSTVKPMKYESSVSSSVDSLDYENLDAASVEMEYLSNRNMDLVKPVVDKSVKIYDKLNNLNKEVASAADIEVVDGETDSNVKPTKYESSILESKSVDCNNESSKLFFSELGDLVKTELSET